MMPCSVPTARETPIVVVASPNIVFLHTCLVMQANHEEVYSSAWIKTPTGWCNVIPQHAGRCGRSQIVTLPTAVLMHFLGDASSSSGDLQCRMNQSPGRWWLVPLQHSHCGKDTRVVTSPNDVFPHVFGDARISRRDVYCRMGQTTWWLVVGILRCSLVV
jgi:hypothetical protein